MLEQRTRVVRFALQNGNRSVLREGSSAASREQGSKKNGSRPLHSQGNGQKLRQPLILDSTPAWNVALGAFRPRATGPVSCSCVREERLVQWAVPNGERYGFSFSADFCCCCASSVH